MTRLIHFLVASTVLAAGASQALAHETVQRVVVPVQTVGWHGGAGIVEVHHPHPYYRGYWGGPVILPAPVIAPAPVIVPAPQPFLVAPPYYRPYVYPQGSFIYRSPGVSIGIGL